MTRAWHTPTTMPDGSARTQETTHALDPEGRPPWARRRSALFSIPSASVWLISAVIAAALWIAAIL